MKVVLGADTGMFNRRIAASSAGLSKFKVGVAAAGVAVIGLGVAMGVSFIKAAALYQDAMAKVKAISGATVEQFKALEEEAKRLGKVTKFTLVQIAGGMEALARGGMIPLEIIKSMGGVAALAASQSIELAEAGSIVIGALRGMQLGVSETDRAVNLFAATAASANLNVSMLSESFKMFAPLAAIYGISIETVAGMVGKLGDANLQGTRATRVLATALAKLAAPSTEALKVFEDLEITMWDLEDRFVGMESLVEQLEAAYANLTPRQQAAASAAIFGVRAFTQMSVLIGVGGKTLREYIESITDTTEALRQQQIMADTVAGQWVILSGSIDLLKTTLGLEALPVIQNFLKDVLIPWVNYMTDASEGTSVLKKAVDELIVPFDWMIKNGQKVKTAMMAIGAGLAVMVAVTHPILALVAALAALIVTFVDLEALAGDIPDKFESFGNAIKGFVEDMESGGVAAEKFIEHYQFTLLNFLGLMDEFQAHLLLPGLPGETALKRITKEIETLKKEVLKLRPEEMADAFRLGIDIILSDFTKFYPKLEELREGWLGLEKAAAKEWANAWLVATRMVRLLQEKPWGVPPTPPKIIPVVSVWENMKEFIDKFGDAVQTALTRAFGQVGALGYDLVSGLVAGMVEGGVWGPLASAAVNAFIAVIDALMAEMDRVKQAVQDMADWIGKRLLQGLGFLVTKTQELAKSFANLIASTQVYGELQSALQQIQSAVMNALLGFLWPLVAIAQELLSIVGITTEISASMAAVAATMAAVEIGVPRAWKRRRRAYEAAAPGEPYYPPVVPDVSGVEPQLPAWVVSIMHQFRGMIDASLEPFKRFVGLLGEAWKALAPIILRGVLPAFETFGKNLVTLAQSILDNIPVFKKHLPSVIRGFLDFFFGAISGVATFWVDTFTDLLPNLDSFSVQLGELGKKLPGLFKALSDALTPVLATFVDAFAGVTSWINTTFLPDFKGFLSAFGGWWRTEVDPFLKAKVFPVLQRWFTSLYEWIKVTFLPFLKTDVWPFVKNTLWPVIKQWGTIFSNFLKRVGDWVIANWPTIERLLTAVLNSLTQKLTAFLGRIEWWLDVMLRMGPTIPGFQAGGVVPGPIGRPQLVVAHGGEEILTHAQRQQSGDILVEVHAHFGQEELSDFVIERVRWKSKRLTGSRSTAAALTRRAYA